MWQPVAAPPPPPCPPPPPPFSPPASFVSLPPSSPCSKTYTYDLHLEPVGDPFLHRVRHRPRRPDRLNLPAMADAARLLVGASPQLRRAPLLIGAQTRRRHGAL